MAGLGWKPMRNREKQAIRGNFGSDLEFVCIFGQDGLEYTLVTVAEGSEAVYRVAEVRTCHRERARVTARR